MANMDSENSNFAKLLTQGVLSQTGYGLNSERLVLPYFYTALGAPLLYAGLIVPVYQAGYLLSQLFLAPAVQAARRNKQQIAAAFLGAAAGVSAICLLVYDEPSWWMSLVFLAMVAVMAVGMGLSSLGFQDMLGRVLATAWRNRLLFVQSGLSGVVTALIACGSELFLTPATSRQAHTELMWAGVAMFVLAGLAILWVHEPEKQPATTPNSASRTSAGRVVENVRYSIGKSFALNWFRRFIVARTLLLSVELAMPFYAIHAAMLHTDVKTSLATFLIASSAGLAVGAFVWPRLGAVSIRLLLVATPCITILAGALAVAIDMQIVPQTVAVHAAVFTLVGFAAQGASNGRALYVIGMSDDDDRPHCIAVSSLIVGVTAVALSTALGALAQLNGALWPVYVVIALNVVAAVYTRLLPEPPKQEAGGQEAGRA